MNRVRSMSGVFSDDVAFPHLYEGDIIRLAEMVDKMAASGDKDIADLALLLRHVLDWVVAESLATTRCLRMIAMRDEDGAVVVVNTDIGVSGVGDNVIIALQNCAGEMGRVLDEIEQKIDATPELQDLLAWAQEFPPYDGQS